MNVDIDISNVVLHTPRLTLRPWCYEDVDDFYEYASVDGVGQMAGWQPHESKEVSLEVLTSFIEGKKTFALEYEGKVIGSLGIEKYKEEFLPEFADIKARELGFVLSKDYWGQGLMREAAASVIRYLFEEVGLDVLFCGHFLWNRQSARVQEKLGFTHYAYHTHTTRLGTSEEVDLNILTKDTFEHNKQFYA